MIRNPGMERASFSDAWAPHGGAKSLSPTEQGERRSLSALAVSPLIARLRHRIARLASPRDGRVLEVGVGRGAGLSGYAPQLEVIGTDNDHDKLRAARRRVAAQALDHVAGLHYMQPSALSFASDSFDLVTAFFVLKRGRRPLGVIDELVRVTKPGGRIVVVNRVASAQARRILRGMGHIFTRCINKRLHRPSLSTPLAVLAKRSELNARFPRHEAVIKKFTHPDK